MSIYLWVDFLDKSNFFGHILPRAAAARHEQDFNVRVRWRGGYISAGVSIAPAIVVAVLVAFG